MKHKWFQALRMGGFVSYIKTLVSELEHSNFGFLVTYVAFFSGFSWVWNIEVYSKKVRCHCIYS